jgi:phenylalanyl-tRNA synthetase beta chain
LYDARAVPVFPAVLEDLAIIVDENVPAAHIEEVMRKAGGSLLVDVELFDIFRGEQIGEGKKSLAYRLTYQSAERTLNESDAARLRNAIVQGLEHELGAQIRSQ